MYYYYYHFSFRKFSVVITELTFFVFYVLLDQLLPNLLCSNKWKTIPILSYFRYEVLSSDLTDTFHLRVQTFYSMFIQHQVISLYNVSTQTRSLSIKNLVILVFIEL